MARRYNAIRARLLCSPRVLDRIQPGGESRTTVKYLSLVLASHPSTDVSDRRLVRISMMGGATREDFYDTLRACYIRRRYRKNVPFRKPRKPPQLWRNNIVDAESEQTRIWYMRNRVRDNYLVVMLFQR